MCLRFDLIVPTESLLLLTLVGCLYVVCSASTNVRFVLVSPMCPSDDDALHLLWVPKVQAGCPLIPLDVTLAH